MPKQDKETTEEIVINRKQLKIEIIIIALFLAVMGIFFLATKAMNGEEGEEALSSDPAQALYNMVVKYDYSKGRSEILETRIKTAIEGESIPTYYDYKAKVEYYYRLGRYHTTINALNNMIDTIDVPLDQTEEAYVYKKYADCYDKLGNQKLKEEWEAKFKEISEYHLYDEDSDINN